ncbi:MAG: [protein-PII] uridylyltransferase [Verrucomicrobia bacterium]|nr:[protein-PII] uridylyltransferase [Verrucomicrobiota bacterium]
MFSGPTTRASRHREMVLAHAEQQLASQGMDDEAQLLTLYKKFLRIENHRLRLKHQAGGGGREIAQQRAVLVDIVLRHLYNAATRDTTEKAAGCGIALVAIGGFGRGELSPHSDVDLMFLHEAAVVPKQIGSIIESILRALWDVGFKVGHSTRSIEGAIKQANADMLSKTSLLESRFIAGDRKLYDAFKAEFEKKCILGHEKEYLIQRLENQKERHLKNGSKVTMQEPNIKSGCGSLRDYQNLIWVSIFTNRAGSTSKLVELKLLPESERRKLDRAYDFLLRVRAELHYLNKRASDSLSHVYQLQVATKLGYDHKNPLRRIEIFMRDYYQHARAIFQITETTAAKLSKPGEKPEGVMRFLKRKTKREGFDGFYLADGLLYPESREIFKEDPFRMMRAFQHAQLRHADFAPELQTLVRRRLQLVDRTYTYARSVRETFAAILSRKGEVGRILRMMHECDFLGRYLPEFAPLTCLVQHEFFHRYTADEHTLVCLEKLDELIDTDSERLQGYRELFKKIDDPFVLYLAMLLHDVGKSANARFHAEASAMAAARIAARLQLQSEQRKMLTLLVDQHILLSSTAQRRNVEDPATISEFANAVRNQANLDALMLVTLADGMGVGDNTWSDWKESLVWQLYRSASRYLAEGEAFFEQRVLERRTTREAVLKRLGSAYAGEVDAHFMFMPDVYFNSFEEMSIASHIRLFRVFFEMQENEGLAPAVRWIPRPDRGHSELWVCTWDRKHLLAKIAGSLAVAHLNILSADIYTRSDNLVFDVFRVCDTNFQAVTNTKDIALVENTLGESLSMEDFDFRAALQKAMHRRPYLLSQEMEFPTRIVIDNDTHPVYTVVDIQTPDRLGLLYNILTGFGEADLNIALSRVATEKGAAIDSFYVTNAKGEKIRETKSVARLQRLLQKAAERAKLEGQSKP